MKFLFATTEVEKLPVTVLSRCQRFDLRRIDARALAAHFAALCDKEQVEADGEALAMIAAAAEGSVRDGLSILDQAIAHADLDADGRVHADQVRDMLGLADKGAQRALLTALLAGDGAAVLGRVAAQFALGVEPVALVRGVMGLVSRITVAQVGGQADDALSAEEREAVAGWSRSLSPGQLHRLWQLLLKGYEEVRTAPDPLIAAQMALLRVMHAADMPDPGELARRLEAAMASAPAAIIGPAPEPQPPAPPSWAELADQVEGRGQLHLAQVMRDWVRVVSLLPGELRFALAPGFSGDPSAELREALCKVTGERWLVERVVAEGEPTLRERAEAAAAEQDAALRRDPLVAATLAAFPDATFVDERSEQQSRRS